MTGDVWVLLAKTAGIGGIAVAAVVTIFRDIIREKVFVKLTRHQSFTLLRLIVVLTGAIGVLGVLGWVLANRPVPPSVVEVPVEVLTSALSQVNCCSEWEIMGAKLPEDEKHDLLHIIELFKQGEYEQARQQLESLEESSDFVTRFKTDYRTGIFFAEGRYKEALVSVLERYNKLPLTDVRYRWDIAYIIYHFRLRRGVDECEQTLAELKTRFPRLDLSPVWMAIQPTAHERLLQADLHPYQTLNEKQIAILKYVVEKYPRDAFIDHAMYFLKEYDRIIQEFPSSLILDRAYYSRAYLAFYQLNNNQSLVSQELIGRIQGQFQQFLDKFPDNNLADSAFEHLLELQLLRPSPVVAYNSVQSIIKACREKKARLCAYDSSRLKVARAILESFLEKVDAATIKEIFNDNVDGLVFAKPVLQRLVALAFFKESRYAESWAYYAGLDAVLEMGKGEKSRMHAISLAARRDVDEMNRNEALEAALAFKNLRYGSERAIPFLKRYIDLSTDDEDRARGLMLEAFAYRNAGKPEEMAAAFKELVLRFPQSRLADDAMAEIGVSYTLWGEPNYREALSMFNEVIRRYPNGNAVDNCYNWSAYIMRKTGNNEQAKLIYERIRERFPFTRFAKYAARNLEAMERERAPM